MAFFDKKEDVIHIEMTPYGRKLLAWGKFKPHSFRAFDNDILYDSQMINKTEKQNESKNRVIKETPKLKQNGSVTGVESSITDHWSLSLRGTTTEEEMYYGPDYVPKEENIEIYNYPIGQTKNNTNLTPDIKIDLFNGKIESVNKNLEKTKIPLTEIPQINIDIVYRYEILKDWQVENFINTLDYKTPYISQPLDEDDSVIIVYPEIPLARFKSEGELDFKERYTITSYRVEKYPDSVRYEQMKFSKDRSVIVNDLLIDDFNKESDPLEEQYLESIKNNKDFVDNYFKLNKDSDIPIEDICSTVGSLEVKNIYLDEYLPCPDKVQENIQFNPYSTQITKEDVKDCEE
jgi:hypothetical protein